MSVEAGYGFSFVIECGGWDEAGVAVVAEVDVPAVEVDVSVAVAADEYEIVEISRSAVLPENYVVNLAPLCGESAFDAASVADCYCYSLFGCCESFGHSHGERNAVVVDDDWVEVRIAREQACETSADGSGP